MSSISSRMAFLVRLGLVPAEAWDFIIPHGPKVSKVAKEYLFAQVVRDIAKQVQDTKAATQLMDAGREMTGFAAKGLVAGWEEGDDLCPEWFGRIPFPRPKEDIFSFGEEFQQQDNLRTYVSALRYIAVNTEVQNAASILENAAQELESSTNVRTLRAA